MCLKVDEGWERYVIRLLVLTMSECSSRVGSPDGAPVRRKRWKCSRLSALKQGRVWDQCVKGVQKRTFLGAHVHVPPHGIHKGVCGARIDCLNATFLSWRLGIREVVLVTGIHCPHCSSHLPESHARGGPERRRRPDQRERQRRGGQKRTLGCSRGSQVRKCGRVKT